ncbi:MAG: OmpA family protein [Bacteroidota bacterium]
MINSLLVLSLFGQNPSVQRDTLDLYYDIAVYELSESQQLALSETIQQLDTNQLYRLDIIGSADFLGTKESNEVLAENRASTVADYVHIHHPNRIDTVVYKGIGEIPESGRSEGGDRGEQANRKVTLVFRWALEQEEVVVEAPFNSAPDTTIQKPEATESPSNKSLDNIAELEVGDNIILEQLNFLPGRHTLVRRSIPTLKKILEILLANPQVEVEIQGHICCSYGRKNPDGYDIDSKNYRLSENRAKNIYNYLVRNGVDAARLSYKGFGWSRPLRHPEESIEDQNANRRVELKIIKL